MKTPTRAIHEKPISDFVPYTRFVDKDTIRTKDGYLMQVIKLDGVAFETADQDKIDHLKEVRATLLRGLSNSRFALYHHIIRREIDIDANSFFKGDFARELNQKYFESLSHKRLFTNEQYITIIRRPASGAVGLASKIGRTFFSESRSKASRTINL